MYNPIIMIRTQLYLPEEEHKILLTLARQRNESMAKIVRRFIKTGLAKEKSIDRTGSKVMLAIAGLKLKGGPKDLSSRLDYYLYVDPKK